MVDTKQKQATHKEQHTEPQNITNAELTNT